MVTEKATPEMKPAQSTGGAATRTMLLRAPEGQPLPALQRLLRALLVEGVVEGIITPLTGPGGAILPALVKDPARLSQAAVVSPAMPVNLARVLQGMASSGKVRVGAVLRPCETRALVELAKLKQVDLGRLFVVATDCLGTYSTLEHSRLGRERPQALDSALARAIGGDVSPEPGFAFRSACQMCDRPLARQLGNGWSVAVGLVGAGRDGVRLSFAPGAGGAAEVLARALSLEEGPPLPAGTGGERLLEERRSQRAARIEAARESLAGPSRLAETFATCVRCSNCSTACPICYCRECLFRTPAFERSLDERARMAERRGTVRLPADTVLYHLTRMSHVAGSCVGCGMCEAACPNAIPLAPLFIAVAQRVQDTFGYEAGRSLEETLPLSTFQERETNLEG